MWRTWGAATSFTAVLLGLSLVEYSAAGGDYGSGGSSWDSGAYGRGFYGSGGAIGLGYPWIWPGGYMYGGFGGYGYWPWFGVYPWWGGFSGFDYGDTGGPDGYGFKRR